MPRSVRLAPISFSRAVELALQRNDNGAAPDKAGIALCPIPLENFAALAAQLDSAGEMGATPGGPSLSSSAAGTTPFALESRKDIILCTALVYASLDDLGRRRQILHRQEQLVTRLMSIESRRVSAEVDHPLQLTQAKMLRARTRLASAALDAAEQTAHTGMASLLGVPIEDVSTLGDSMPPLPGEPVTKSAESAVLQRLVAFRDIVQLEYVAEFMNRQKVMHDMALARASIGTQVAAEIDELMRFGALIQFNDRLRVAKIQLAGSSGDLLSWAMGEPVAEGRVQTMPHNGEPGGAMNRPGADVKPGTLLGLLLAPDIAQLPIGKSQQFSAIVTDNEGHAKDVTAEAKWTCSSDAGAVLSTTGLLTALSEGPLMIRVEYQGLVSSRKLMIATRPAEEGASF